MEVIKHGKMLIKNDKVSYDGDYHFGEREIWIEGHLVDSFNPENTSLSESVYLKQKNLVTRFIQSEYSIKNENAEIQDVVERKIIIYDTSKKMKRVFKVVEEEWGHFEDDDFYDLEIEHPYYEYYVDSTGQEVCVSEELPYAETNHDKKIELVIDDTDKLNNEFTELDYANSVFKAQLEDNYKIELIKISFYAKKIVAIAYCNKID